MQRGANDFATFGLYRILNTLILVPKWMNFRHDFVNSHHISNCDSKFIWNQIDNWLAQGPVGQITVSRDRWTRTVGGIASFTIWHLLLIFQLLFFKVLLHSQCWHIFCQFFNFCSSRYSYRSHSLDLHRRSWENSP